MALSRKTLIVVIFALILGAAMLGGVWSAASGAGLQQGTLPTGTIPTATIPTATPVTPTARPPEPQPTATPLAPPPALPFDPNAPLTHIDGVVRDTSVTLTTSNFPPNTTFVVLMNVYGTLGIGGIQVDEVTSDGDVNTWTFLIPDALKGLDRIAIRLQSADGYYSFNWFWNFTAGDNSNAPEPNTPAEETEDDEEEDGSEVGTLPPGVFPSINFQGVVSGQSVTILADNLPVNDKFVVTINNYGTLGVGGVEIGEIDAGDAGSGSFTFEIPKAYRGLDRIAIRVYSSLTGYYAYNWFWNNNYP